MKTKGDRFTTLNLSSKAFTSDSHEMKNQRDCGKIMHIAMNFRKTSEDGGARLGGPGRAREEEVPSTFNRV